MSLVDVAPGWVLASRGTHHPAAPSLGPEGTVWVMLRSVFHVPPSLLSLCPPFCLASFTDLQEQAWASACARLPMAGGEQACWCCE